MNALIAKTLFICCIATVVTGCKFALMVTADGDVSSSSGTRDCAGGTICEFEITDTDFSETFTATAREGYVFSKWQAGDGYLCANSTNPVCAVSNVPATGIPGVDAFILTGTYFYAKPVFTFVGIDTDKTVFVTSETYNGNLGGLTGADQKCNTLAAAASLPGSYKAWLSTSNGSPSTRFVQSSVPYKLVDGTVIAEDYADLVDGALLAHILLTEEGSLPLVINPGPNSFLGVWTGTAPDGTYYANSGPDGEMTFNCADFTTGMPIGFDSGVTGFPWSGGAPTQPGDIWTNGGGADCRLDLPFYCFQQ